jgi:hypothetical protein
MRGKPRLIVELEPGADPIRGSIREPHGRSRPFWGWLELIDHVRRLALGEKPGAPADEGEAAPDKSEEASR